MSSTVEVLVGVIGRAHGVRGQVAIEVRTDEPARRFRPGAVLRRASGGTLTVGTVQWLRGRLLLTFDGVPDRTAVEALRGEQLLVDVPANEQPSEPEEYFDRHLVGLRVQDHTGATVGEIDNVVHLPAQDVLVVRTSQGQEHMVPFVTALVPVVNVSAGHVRLADVRGLLEEPE